MRDWVTNVRTTHYLLGSVLGAHPYPTMVRDFHRVISREARAQILEKENRLPNAIIACVGGGSNAIGAFYEFIPDKERPPHRRRSRRPRLRPRRTRRPLLQAGSPRRSPGHLLLRPAGRRTARSPCTHSVSAGLDYASIGPEHAALHDSGRAEYTSATDAEALDATLRLARTEGIIPALESAHAVAECIRIAPQLMPPRRHHGQCLRPRR